ncbi:unnamed protein product [Sphagnum balticum]
MFYNPVHTDCYAVSFMKAKDNRCFIFRCRSEQECPIRKNVNSTTAFLRLPQPPAPPGIANGTARPPANLTGITIYYNGSTTLKPQLISIGGRGQNGQIQLVHVDPANGTGTNPNQQLIRVNPNGGQQTGIQMIHVNVLRYVGPERSVAGGCEATLASRYTPDSTGWRPGAHAGIQPYALPPYTDMAKCFEECCFTIGGCTKYLYRRRLYGAGCTAVQFVHAPIPQCLFYNCQSINACTMEPFPNSTHWIAYTHLPAYNQPQFQMSSTESWRRQRRAAASACPPGTPYVSADERLRLAVATAAVESRCYTDPSAPPHASLAVDAACTPPLHTQPQMRDDIACWALCCFFSAQGELKQHARPVSLL